MTGSQGGGGFNVVQENHIDSIQDTCSLMVDDGRGVLYRYVGDNDPLWVNPYQPIRLEVVTKQAQKGVELAARCCRLRAAWNGSCRVLWRD